MFPVNGSLTTWHPPSLERVPVSPVPRRHEYYEGATTPTLRITGHLFVSLPVSTRALHASCSLIAALPGGVEVPRRARIIVQPAIPLPARSHVDVSGTSQVPRQSVLCLCSVLRPRPNRRTLANNGCVDAAPAKRRAKAPACYQFRGYRGASAHAVYASRAVLPPPHARLASGWRARLCREGVEPSGLR